MIFRSLINRSERLIVDNTPLILTTVGVVGTVATAVLTGKSTIKAIRILEDENAKREMETVGEVKPLTKFETVRLVGVQYLPPLATGTATIGAIVCAHRISAKRLVAITAAYSLSQDRFNEYKDKVAEKFGVTKETQVRDEIAQDQADRTPVTKAQIIITGNGDAMFMDSMTGRYFKSNVEKLNRAMNDLNQRILTSHDVVSLTDFYEMIGLEGVEFSNEIGFNTENLIDLHFSGVLTDDNQPCIVMTFATTPVRDFEDDCYSGMPSYKSPSIRAVKEGLG